MLKQIECNDIRLAFVVSSDTYYVRTTHALQILGGGGRTPATPPPKSAPGSTCTHVSLDVIDINFYYIYIYEIT